MKRNASIFLAIVMVLTLLMGYSFAAASQDDFSSIEKVTLRLAHIYTPDHPFSIGIDKFVETCKQNSDGKLEIQHFPAAQLGNEPSLHEAMRNGTLEMSIMGISEVGKRFEPVMVHDAPFFFRDVDHLFRAFEHPVDKKLWAEFEAATGIKMLIPIHLGTRHLSASKPIHNTAELAGVKVRVPDQKNNVESWRAMGATPTPMNLAECYLALQTGVVDGQENPLSNAIANKLYEVAKYFTLTAHSVQATPLFISVAAYEKLDPALVKVLEDAIQQDIVPISKAVQEYESSELKRLVAEEGVQVFQPDLDDFRNKIRPYIQSMESTWGAGVYDALTSIQ